MSGSVFLVTSHNAYASTKPKSLKQAEVIFYPGRTSPMFTCELRHYAFDTVLSIFSQILRRSLTARESVDFRGQMHGDKALPFSGVTSYGRVWRKGAGKRGLESGLHSLTTKQ